MTTRAYGWIAPPEGHHRGVRAAPPGVDLGRDLPPHVVLGHAPPVTDQGPLGSCTGHAVACAAGLRLRSQGLGQWLPSPIDLYLGARALEGTSERDAGALLADVLRHAELAGLAPDALWPHAERGAEFRGPPPPPVSQDRGRTRLVTHEPLDWDLDTLRWELASGFPIVIGVRTYRALEEVDALGVVPMPDGAQVGGHAMCVVGYSDNRGAFLVQNSWGASWGARGRAWIPYRYAVSPFWCGELHAVRVVRVEAP